MNRVALDMPIREGAAPQVAAESQNREQASAHAPTPRPTAVLVIEDERPLLRSLERGLLKRGFAVWCAANGADAVDLYRHFGAQIDVVLSDLNMPVLDGIKTLDALRAINPLVRFCFMTGDTRPSTLADLSRRGAMRILTKPFTSVADVAVVLRELASVGTTDPVGSLHGSGA